MSEETTAIVKQDNDFLAPVADLDTILRAYQLKREFIEKVLKEDLDFGKIAGSLKPALLKPGAEKLANIYGFAPVFEDIITIEDWSGADHDGELFFYYRQKCKLYRGDRLIGSADGSCNSWEKKYRFREGQRVCPNCGQPTIFKSKPPKTGYYCWQKKGGCGTQFSENDTTITKQETGLVKNPDICDVINTVLKMAQKRALVAAILITTGASDYFTQDVDDFIDLDSAIDSTWKPEPEQSSEPVKVVVQPVPAPSNGNSKTVVETAAELGATVKEIVYTGNLAVIGKHKYPVDWAKALAAQPVNVFEVDGILQKLALAQEEPAAVAVKAVTDYLDNKAK